MKKVCLLFLFLAVFFTGQPSEGQSPLLIYVSVSGTDDNAGEITATLLKSYVEKGVRELGDHAKIVPSFASSYQLKIIFLEHRDAAGVRTGNMSISYVLTKLSFGSNSCECYISSYILIWKRSNIREGADLIVANINKDINP